MSRAVEGYMTKAGCGRIVNLSSTSALGKRGQANYAAAKAGLQGFTKTLSLELGKFGVTVNAVAPGFIETEMTAATAQRVGVDFVEFKKAAAAQIPVARTGTPDDIAHAVSFFVSEGAGFVSGQVIYVAGGPMTRYAASEATNRLAAQRPRPTARTFVRPIEARATPDPRWGQTESGAADPPVQGHHVG